MSPFMLPPEAELLDCVAGLEVVDLSLLPHAAATSASAPAPPPPIIFRKRRRDPGSRCSSSSAFTVSLRWIAAPGRAALPAPRTDHQQARSHFCHACRAMAVRMNDTLLALRDELRWEPTPKRVRAMAGGE